MKSRSTSSIGPKRISTALTNQNTRSFQRISHQQSPRNEHSYVIRNTTDNDPLTRSILIDSAARQQGFLPYDYRSSNTFEGIRRQRTYCKTPLELPVIPPPVHYQRSTRTDVFGNSTSKLSKLAEQRLVLHDKSNRKQPNTTSMPAKHDKPSYIMSDADFATDIPNALELMLKKTKRKSVMERHILEIITRERVKQARYRLLPIDRAPCN